jgi:hypothetical protein
MSDPDLEALCPSCLELGQIQAHGIFVCTNKHCYRAKYKWGDFNKHKKQGDYFDTFKEQEA